MGFGQFGHFARPQNHREGVANHKAMAYPPLKAPLQKRTPMKYLAALVLFQLVAQNVLAAQSTLEISGVTVRPGITTEEAIALFKGRDIVVHDDSISVQRPLVVGNGKTITVVAGSLHIRGNTVTYACRYWDRKDSSDAELAQALFSILDSAPDKDEHVSIETGTTRKPDGTTETTIIHIGQRSIYITHQDLNNVAKDVPSSIVFIEECVSMNGITLSLPQ
jgi:hypothetical protein